MTDASTATLVYGSRRMLAFRQFFRTPKGVLLLVLLFLAAIAAPVVGLARAAIGLSTAAGVAAAMDLVILRLRENRWAFPSGAILTGLIAAMVLAPETPWYVEGATSAIAIGTKWLFRTRMANIFNPAALALVVVFYLFDTGQSWWGALPDHPMAGVAVLLVTGIFISDRVNKLPMVLSFLGSYFVAFSLAAFLGNPATVAEVYRTPDAQAALFFAFFILTDPPTSPTRYPHQTACGVLVALVGFIAFEWIGAAYFLLAGVLAGNLWEAGRRWRAGRVRRRHRRS